MLHFFTKNKISFCVYLCVVLLTAWTLISCDGDKDQSAPPVAGDQKQGVEKIIAQEQGNDKIPLRILYVGSPDIERQRDFVSFLSKHFENVKTADLYAFKEEQAKDCDVAIFDKDGIDLTSLNIKVSEQYTRATISIGIPGAFWCSGMKLKTGYM